MVSIVKWFNDAKGYGFINYDDRDVFVHYSQIIDSAKRKTLITGQKVEFETICCEKGLRALNVRVVK